MQKEYESTRSKQGSRNTDHTHPTGFRPLALPAVVAAVKAMARRVESHGPANALDRRMQGST